MAWAEVWRTALREASVVLVLRVALDDAHAPVMAAAAEALAALVAPRGAHGAALAAADACPLGGARLVAADALPAVHLRRLLAHHVLGLECAEMVSGASCV